MTTCYSCKKEIGIFKPRGTAKDILKAGYKTPDGMSEHDRLCQGCLDEIRRTQPQGSTIRQTRPMKMTVFIPLGLFAIWFILKFGYTQIDLHPELLMLLMGGLAWGFLITGCMVVWDYYKSWRKRN